MRDAWHPLDPDRPCAVPFGSAGMPGSMSERTSGEGFLELRPGVSNGYDSRGGSIASAWWRPARLPEIEAFFYGRTYPFDLPRLEEVECFGTWDGDCNPSLLDPSCLEVAECFGTWDGVHNPPPPPQNRTHSPTPPSPSPPPAPPSPTSLLALRRLGVSLPQSQQPHALTPSGSSVLQEMRRLSAFAPGNLWERSLRAARLHARWPISTPRGQSASSHRLLVALTVPAWSVPMPPPFPFATAQLATRWPISLGEGHRLLDVLTVPEESATRPPSPCLPSSVFMARWAALCLQGQRTRGIPTDLLDVGDFCNALEALRALAVEVGRRTDDADLELVAYAAFEALCPGRSHVQLMRHLDEPSDYASDPTGLIDAVTARRRFLWDMSRSPCDLPPAFVRHVASLSWLRRLADVHQVRQQGELLSVSARRLYLWLGGEPCVQRHSVVELAEFLQVHDATHRTHGFAGRLPSAPVALASASVVTGAADTGGAPFTPISPASPSLTAGPPPLSPRPARRVRHARSPLPSPTGGGQQLPLPSGPPGVPY